MKNKLILFSGIFALALGACASKNYQPEDYTIPFTYTAEHALNGFRILQITDIHVGDKDNMQLHYDFMDLTINEAHPDLIVLTGDVFTFASKGTAKELFTWMDSHEVPWTLTFGNHDEQCFFSVDWLTSYLNGLNDLRVKNGEKKSYCIFKDLQDDNIQGNANFAINLMSGGHVFEQLIIMDSNRYNYNGYFGYDYFHQDQIDWYSRLVDHTKAQNGNIAVPSLMFYHIPLPEVRDAWAAAEKDPTLLLNPDGKGQQNEEPCNPKYNSGFFEVIKDKGSTHGMYFGHDHINNYIVNYQGIHFGYGIKATDRVYADDAMLGGRVITLQADHSLSYEDYYHTYGEVK